MKNIETNAKGDYVPMRADAPAPELDEAFWQGARVVMPTGEVVDIDNPEVTEADFARAKPFREVFPELYASWKREGVTIIPVQPEESPDIER